MTPTLTPAPLALPMAGRTVPALSAGPRDADHLAVLLHGFPDTPWGWWPVMSALASRGWWAVAPRLHGPGGRTAPARSYQVADLGGEASDLCASVRRLSQQARAHRAAVRSRSQPASLSLVGHDWGAVATWFATLRRDAPFQRSVLLSVPPTPLFLRALLRSPAQRRRSAYMLRFQLPRVPERALAAAGGELVEALWRRWSPGLDLGTPPASTALAAATAALSDADRARAALATYRGLRRAGAVPNRWTALRARIRSALDLTGGPVVPTILAYGDADGCIGPEVYRGATRWCDHVHRIERRGHFLALEAPTTVVDLITGELDEMQG